MLVLHVPYNVEEVGTTCSTEQFKILEGLKAIKNKKKKSGKKKETNIDPPNSDGIRRGSYLSDEVLAAVRRDRAFIFVYHLSPKIQQTNMRKKENPSIHNSISIDLI